MSKSAATTRERALDPVSSGSITLSTASVGCDLRIRALEGTESFCHRLREMGFCEQAQVKKLSDSGNLICSVCGTRLALSREVAEGIIVEQA
jgi:Fe2+ transport system protein FeoA